MLKQNGNNLFRDREETVRCLRFRWCEDLACDKCCRMHGAMSKISEFLKLVLDQSYFLLLEWFLTCQKTACVREANIPMFG